MKPAHLADPNADGLPESARRENALLARTRRRLLAGYAVSAFFAFGIVGYAATAEIRGAVIAQGNMVVEGNQRKVQHQDGGIVSAIHVRNGQRVKAGDLVIRLDDTQRRAEFGQVVGQLMSQELRAARLEAERDALPTVVLPASVASRLAEPEVAALVAAETTLFEARRRSRLGEEAQLRERVVQIRDEIAGLEAQQKSVIEQAKISEQELANLEGLQRQGLTQVSRVNPLRRTIVQLEGQAGELLAQIARARGRISETELQITQIEKQALNEITRDLRETKDKIADLAERRTATEEKLRRTEIRAPINAVVHQLSVFTIGGVIAPGEAVMQLVPEGERLLVESKIEPGFIDQVAVGQPAIVRLSSLDSRTTPELAGKVTFISADLEQDQRQPGVGHFRARVELDPGEAERLGEQRLMPGLPAEIHIQTRERTILSYFMKPFSDQIARAFRER
jgi:HlyD family secretion protein